MIRWSTFYRRHLIDADASMKIIAFWFKFQWISLLKVLLVTYQSSLVLVMAWFWPGRQLLAEPMMNPFIIHWSIYASQGLNELTLYISGPIYICIYIFHQTSNISHTLVGNKLVDHSDVVGACWRCSNYIFILDLTLESNAQLCTGVTAVLH